MTGLPKSVDAVVIGSGPNGLVCAALLADAGWSVCLLEAQDEFGGAVKSQVGDGWTMDRFSSCYPLAVASSVMLDLGLEDYGLRWARAQTQVAHPLSTDDEEGAAIHQDPEVTAANLAAEVESDGAAWLDLCAQYDVIKHDFLAAMLTSWPPVAAAKRLLRKVGGPAGALRLARFLALPTTRMGAEIFRGQRGRALLAGNAMHADAPPEAPVSGVMGWLMCMLAQDVGFPSPVGGAGQLSGALVKRARAAGAVLYCGEPVVGVQVRGGKAVGVHTASGTTIAVRRAVVGDVSALSLYRELLAGEELPALLRNDLQRFEPDLPTVKVNYRLSRTPEWTARQARSAGVVHVGHDVDGLVHWSADLSTQRVPQVPFALIGQTSTIDSTRSPTGTEALWAYTHLPRGVTDEPAAQELASRLDAMLEAHAPGFGGLVLDRDVQTPDSLHAENANLVNGAVGGGTSQLHQQLVFRPVPGFGGAHTFIDRLYLGSAAIHPGGGVHGSCGSLAAQAALSDAGFFGGIRRKATSAAIDRIYRARSSN